MRIVVLGASGGVGGWVVRHASARGHEVTAVVREGSAPPAAPGVVVRRGDVRDPGFLREAVAGAQRVVSCLGLRRAGLSPWAPILSPPDLVTTVAGHLASLCRPGGPPLLLVSAGGVGDSRDQLSLPVRRLVVTAGVGVAYRDLERAETLLREAGANWTAVRPVTLVNGRPTGRVGPVGRYGLLSTVRRSDVGLWLVHEAEKEGETGGQVLLGAGPLLTPRPGAGPPLRS